MSDNYPKMKKFKKKLIFTVIVTKKTMSKCAKGTCNYCHIPRLSAGNDTLLKYFDDNNIKCGNCKNTLTVDSCPCCEHECNKNYCTDCMTDYLNMCNWCGRTSCCDKEIKLLPYETWKNIFNKKTYFNHICSDCNNTHKVVKK